MISDERGHTPRRVPQPPDETLFRELCSALATVAAEDPRYTMYVSTDAHEETHTPLDDHGNTLEQVLVAAVHQEVLFRKRNRDSQGGGEGNKGTYGHP
ncbi:MAG: hypothetical protein ACRDRU_19680 [Pseudonocardiaceae bacterium]